MQYGMLDFKVHIISYLWVFQNMENEGLLYIHENDHLQHDREFLVLISVQATFHSLIWVSIPLLPLPMLELCEGCGGTSG